MKLNNIKTVIENKEQELNKITNDIKPIVNEKWDLINNVNYYMNIKHFWKEYIFILIIVFIISLFIANNWSTVVEVMLVTILVFIIILVINHFVTHINATKNIPEIIKEKFEINQNTPIYIDEYNCVCQAPSKNNPFMNVLVSDYIDNPYRPKACNPSNPDIEKQIVNYFYSNPAFINTHDIYQRHNDMHQWYTQPATTIPYDREGWISDSFRYMNSCKDDQKYCINNLWDIRRP